MIDTVRSHFFHRSLHTSWSHTFGISKMNDLPLTETGEVIFSYAHVKAKKKNMTQRKHSLTVLSGNGRDHFSCLHNLSCFKHPLAHEGVWRLYIAFIRASQGNFRKKNNFDLPRVFLYIFNYQCFVAMFWQWHTSDQEAWNKLKKRRVATRRHWSTLCLSSLKKAATARGLSIIYHPVIHLFITVYTLDMFILSAQLDHLSFSRNW